VLRMELVLQFGSDPLNFECLLLNRDIRGGFQFFDSYNERLKLVTVSPFNLGGSLRQFGLETRPDILLIVVVLLEEQAEGFFRTKLGNAGEVFHPETIQNLGSFQFAFAQTQWALYGIGRHC